jgi:hypothetical protein
VPLPNVPGNRYTASPNVEDDRNQAGIRLDYHTSDKHSILGRYLWSHSNRLTPRTVQAVDQLAKATLQDLMFADTYTFTARTINVARFSLNRIYANPRSRAASRTPPTGSTCPTRTRWPWVCPRSPCRVLHRRHFAG